MTGVEGVGGRAVVVVRELGEGAWRCMVSWEVVCEGLEGSEDWEMEG